MGTVWIQLLLNWGTVMRDATTPPRAGEVSVGRRGDIHRQVLPPLPSASLVPLREGQLCGMQGEAVSKYTFHPLMTLITPIFHLYIIPNGYYLSAQSA